MTYVWREARYKFECESDICLDLKKLQESNDLLEKTVTELQERLANETAANTLVLPRRPEQQQQEGGAGLEEEPVTVANKAAEGPKGQASGDQGDAVMEETKTSFQ